MENYKASLKRVAIIFTVAIAGVALLVPLALAASAEDGARLANDRCLGCHSIGEGDSDTGPDLIDVGARRSDDWLHQILEYPNEFAASGDPEKQALASRFKGSMPDLGLSDDEVNSIIMFLRSEKIREGVTGPRLPPGDADRGRRLFVGEVRQTNGGSACITCHNAGDFGPEGMGPLGGGSMAADLTGIYTRLQEKRLASALGSLKYPIMVDVFQDKPLTDQEIADLVAFFKDISKQAPPSPAVSLITFAVAGIGVVIVLLIISHFIWGKRIQGVRKRLVGGSH